MPLLNVTLSSLPADWIIEFSDPVFGQRFGAKDEIKLEVPGRTCPTTTTSQHDRRFIYGDSGA
jgi:hypothetical protein